MEIRIRETQELKELNILSFKRTSIGTYDSNDWTSDLLGDADALHYNKKTDEHEMDADEFEFWEGYISDYMADEAEIDEIIEKHPEFKMEIKERLCNDLNNDYGEHHRYTQNILDDIRKKISELEEDDDEDEEEE